MLTVHVRFPARQRLTLPEQPRLLHADASQRDLRLGAAPIIQLLNRRVQCTFQSSEWRRGYNRQRVPCHVWRSPEHSQGCAFRSGRACLLACLGKSFPLSRRGGGSRWATDLRMDHKMLEPVRVMARVRPLSEDEVQRDEESLVQVEGSKLTLLPPSTWATSTALLDEDGESCGAPTPRRRSVVERCPTPTPRRRHHPPTHHTP